jgi:hypothetical protein
MIPISFFNVMVVIDVFFIAYSVIDHRNRLYANVVLAFLAGMLSAYLALAIQSGIVYDTIGGSINIINSGSAGNFLYLVSTVMFVYTIIMVYEVLDEAFQKKKQNALNKEEERV